MSVIDTQRLLMEMRAVAQQTQMSNTAPIGQAAGVDAAGAQAVDGQAGSTDFASMMRQALDSVNDQQVKSKDLKEAIELGEPGVELSEVMLQAQKASLAFQAMTQVRNKLVDAYKDVMSMPM